jgi:N-acetyl-alpha-D-glucosaminyl L-malate synthase BshA
MRIGIVCYPTYGGSGVIATELGKSLADKGHMIHFISYALPMRLDGYLGNIFFHEVEMSSYPLFEFPMYTPALASKIVEVARFEKLDLIHAHYAIPHAISAFLAREILEGSLKVITTLHGTDITLVGLEPSYLSVMKFSIERSDGVTAVSRFLREKTMTNYGITKDIRVIPNFVDTEKYKRSATSEVRERLAPHGEMILVHISNFRAVKRVPDVIRIFHEVRKKVPSVLLLVGDGPDRSTCELLAREHPLPGKAAGAGPDPLRRGSDAHAQPVRKFRPFGARGDGLRGSGDLFQCRGAPRAAGAWRNRIYRRDRRHQPHVPLCDRTAEERRQTEALHGGVQETRR